MATDNANIPHWWLSAPPPRLQLRLDARRALDWRAALQDSSVALQKLSSVRVSDHLNPSPRNFRRVNSAKGISVLFKVAADEEKSSGDRTMTPTTSPASTPITTPTTATSAAAAFLAWPPLLLHPWAPALLPGAWCNPALRSALPGLVTVLVFLFLPKILVVNESSN